MSLFMIKCGHMAEEPKKEEQKPQMINAAAPFDKLVPKYCTAINFAVTQDKQFIITLSFQEGEQHIIIERVAITSEHAKSLSKVLNELLEKVEKGETENVSKNK